MLANVEEGTHPVDERHEQVQTGQQGLVVLPEALDHAGVALRNDANGAQQNDDDEHRQNGEQGEHEDLSDEGCGVKHDSGSFRRR